MYYYQLYDYQFTINIPLKIDSTSIEGYYLILVREYVLNQL